MIASLYTMHKKITSFSLNKNNNNKYLCTYKAVFTIIFYFHLSSLNYVYRYAKGFGIVRYIFGEDSAFNVPNGLTGMLFYILSFMLSASTYI